LFMNFINLCDGNDIRCLYCRHDESITSIEGKC
jgi:hypothetical protein